MKRRVIAGINRLISWLIALLLLMGVAAAPAYAEEDTTTTNILPLAPKDLVYENGNVILHKHGERIGPTEWKVVVRATIGEEPIEKRKMEVVFLLDISSSMRTNNAHDHDDTCNDLVTLSCNLTEHTHTDDCCSIDAHTHTEECCGKEEHAHSATCCTKEVHTHSRRCCSIQTNHDHEYNNNGGCYQTRCYDHDSDEEHESAGCYYRNNGRWYKLTCTIPEGHTHGDGNCDYCEEEEHAHTDGTCVYCKEEEHEHSQACIDNCTKEVHSHSAACAQYYICGATVEHTHQDECYTASCTLQHTHTLGCYRCPYYGSKPNGDDDDYINSDKTKATRMAVAVVAAERLIANLPKDATTVTRLAFDGDFHSGISSYYDIKTGSGTYMWSAINTVLTTPYRWFSTDDTKKVFVVLTDGEANSGDKSTYQSPAKEKLETFKKPKPDGADGTVFTVGFGYEGEVLGNIASSNEHYLTATDATSLNLAFEELERELTAMLIDPMGTTVGFDEGSILGASTTSGVISWTTDTIYWNPSEDGESTVSNSTIEYSYTVALNANADETVGEHYNVELNNPTDFLYGIKDPTNNTITNMKEAAFPIPRALYKLSSIETSWVDEEGDPIPITGYDETIESAPIISDYKDANYIPAFDSKYTDITQRIYVPDGSGDYYQYTSSTVQAVQYVTYHDDNEEGMTTTKTETIVADVTDLGAIDPSKPYHYTVVHNYKLVKAEKLPLGGTKTLIGRDFQANDEFTFTLTAVTDGAPMPVKDKVIIDEVIIKPTSGTIATFEFGEIDFTNAADKTYVYEIQETEGNLDGVEYDTAVRTLRVTVKDGKVASYTIDGVENAPLHFTNSLTPGNLKVEKTEVTSYKAEHQNQEFNFIIQVKDKSDRPMTGTYTAKKSDGTEFPVTFDAGYVVADGKNYVTLKAGESVVIEGLPMGAQYTVTEDAPGGFTATATGDEGTVVADETVTAFFKNEYHTTGQYQFRATKVLKDADGKILDLTQGQFTFRVLDENGNVIPNGTGDGDTSVVDGTNNDDGSIFFDTLSFTEKDIGADGTGIKTYQIVEVAGSDANILYDRTVYTVTLTIEDDGKGNLVITDDLPVVDEKKQTITFTNTKISNQLVVSKTVAGNLGSRNREFDFTLDLGTAKANTTVNISTDGVNFTQTMLDENGRMDFMLKHGQSISVYPVDGDYTVTEADSGYTTTYSINQAEAVTGTSASGNVDADGEHVAFVNTLEATVPTGIHTPATSALIGICLAVGLIAIALAGRREVFYES